MNFDHFMGFKDATQSEWTLLIWLVIIIAFAAAIVTPDPDTRLWCTLVGAGALIGRIIFNRLVK